MSNEHTVMDLPSLQRPEIVAEVERSRARIDRAFTEIFSGYDLKAEDVLNEVVSVEGYTGHIAVGDISFYSYCGHHFAPFFGTATVTYTPRRIITGLGKLVRLVRDVHAKRLQIQELMTRDIANDVMRVLDAEGVRVVTRAKHLCMCSRGPGDDNAWAEVVYEAGTPIGDAGNQASS
ncbi:MAG TPA: GTP cyclohydrolase I [Allosphingosinicella sp.]|nr:GTP cyclohydrolase I [Allosphingosinicella sp.]